MIWQDNSVGTYKQQQCGSSKRCGKVELPGKSFDEKNLKHVEFDCEGDNSLCFLDPNPLIFTQEVGKVIQSVNERIICNWIQESSSTERSFSQETEITSVSEYLKNFTSESP